MHIKYLPNYRKQDSINGVGLVWEPGQVRNVSPEMAEKLLPYTDTWEKADEDDVEPGSVEEMALNQEAKPLEEPLPVVDFHGMNKKSLIEFAATKYNVKLDKRLSEESVRHKVTALFTQHEMAD